ncbi:sulfide-quinone oxidoreductase [Turnera subulata]|uniref:Sulfide-quinone oxidoreductase n=1 Tax=Turnera subulata TaxID=218843 RepID=A0A9Q0FGF8_9ROSI|nr:sulfide-quinone oxidoreductase [Turnera subulata]KAJ4832161.1 sulfide-quinone oxidoreductase [Turnera subulata]
MGGQSGAETSSFMVDFLRQTGGLAVIDGGLATELERHGADLNDPLWSAKCLLTSPHLIRAVHLDYLQAGADIIITASYQATIQGFEAKGFSTEQSEALLKKSVEIAREARDIYNESCRKVIPDGNIEDKVLKQRPILVAASVGSYGAYLADGSEYSGNYGDAVTLQTLKDFHRRRVQVLAEAGPDIIAFETIPNKVEAQVTNKPILVYPNSGESYDGERKEWVQNTGVSDEDFVSYVNKWCEDGASLVGGCCRTTPNTIKAIYRRLVDIPAALPL